MVVQVVSDNSCLAHIYWYKSKYTPNDLSNNEIQSELVMIANYPTARMLDGKLYETRDVFQVTGTVKYGTAVGSNKVLLLEPYQETTKP